MNHSQYHGCIIPDHCRIHPRLQFAKHQGHKPPVTVWFHGVVMIPRLAVTLLLMTLFGAPLAANAAGGRTVPPSTQATAAQFAYHAAGKYFQFHSNIPPQRLALYAHFSDLFVDLVDRDFFRVKTRFPIHAFVLEDKAKFQAFLRTTFKVAMPSEYGMYLPEAAAFVTYDGSGLGTFTHEIAHPLVEESLPNRPEWAMEGIPAFFEKFYGFVQNGKLQLQWGHQNPWRIEKLGSGLTQLKLIRVVYGSQDTSEKRLVSVFLHQHGKFKTFLELVQADNRRGFRTHLEAAFDKPLGEMEGDWQTYLQKVESNRQRIMTLPSSQVFDTPEQYRQFAARFGL